MNKQYFHGLAATAILAAGSAAAEAGDRHHYPRHRRGQPEFRFPVSLRIRRRGDFEKDAHANTLRSRLTFAPKFEGDWQFLVEIDDVRIIGSDTFNSTRNGRVDRPLVPDPDGTDLNQALVRYTGIDKLELGFGRQRITRGNQRYIGGRAWRQNEQTFDAVSAAYGVGTPFQAYYAYAFQVNLPVGPDSGTPPATFDSNIHLFDARYEASDALRLTGYAYLIDLKDADSLSNATLGIRLEGSVVPADGWDLSYVADYGSAEDYGDNPVSYDSDYYQLEATLRWRRLLHVAGLEVLGGSAGPGGGFRTPLGTLHRIQGLADRFVAGSFAGLDDGLQDLYLSASVQALGGEFLLRYHDFSAERGGADYGTEFDASASWSFADHYDVLAWASYDADTFSFDLSKFWLQLGNGKFLNGRIPALSAVTRCRALEIPAQCQLQLLVAVRGRPWKTQKQVSLRQCSLAICRYSAPTCNCRSGAHSQATAMALPLSWLVIPSGSLKGCRSNHS